MRLAVKRISGFLFNLVFPDTCRLCEEPLTGISRVPVCPACLALPAPLTAERFCRTCSAPFMNRYSLDEDGNCPACRAGGVSFDAAYVFGSYEGALRELIRLLKYGKIESTAQPLSRLLVRALPIDRRFDLVIAMPMHWRKRWVRGFNQAELLAKPVARRLGVKLVKNLRRCRYTPAQASLDEVQRRKSPENSFRVRKARQIARKRVLLIDDVFTTGSTFRAAAAALKAAGATHVSVLAVARVDRRVGAWEDLRHIDNEHAMEAYR